MNFTRITIHPILLLLQTYNLFNFDDDKPISECERGHLVVEAEEIRLPDGQKITIASELVDCSEILFKPSLVGSSSPGLHQLIKESIEL